jgi:EAL domain-containing protein (putative c-di-GMP-specific phosphodiesterase class I)
MNRVSRVDPNSPTGEPGRVHTARADEVRLAEQLRHAVGAGELTVHYQPQYDLTNGRIVALEALCRWNHPQQGLLLPAHFIDLAEQYGLISDVDHFMFEESGRRAGDWHRRGIHVGVAINVSPSELDAAFAEALLQRLTELGLPYRALTVEVTESPEISYSSDELLALEMLIGGGVGVSIDDFGTGRASLELVERLPLTEVKIDRSLVQSPARAIDDAVRTCIEIVRKRDGIVVAEGVETRSHYERAMHWGCDRAQGFYFSGPLPVDEVEPLLLGAA